MHVEKEAQGCEQLFWPLFSRDVLQTLICAFSVHSSKSVHLLAVQLLLLHGEKHVKLLLLSHVPTITRLGAVHCQPFSTEQPTEQPSFGTKFPSSQPSFASINPLPQSDDTDALARITTGGSPWFTIVAFRFAGDNADMILFTFALCV